MQKIISLLGMLLLFSILNAQTPLGKWKLVKGVTLSLKNINTDILKEDYQKQPCLASVVYTLTADGKINTNADQCPDSVKKDLGVANLGIKWRTSGYNIIITTADEDLELTYVWSLSQGPNGGKRTMLWIMDFKDKPDSNNPDPITRVIFTFQEL